MARLRPWLRRNGGDEGSALIEFIGASVLLLIPLVYVLLTVLDLQRNSFAASAAAREAGRAFATAPSVQSGLDRAAAAVRLAFRDQGVDQAPAVRFVAAGGDCGSSPEVRPTLTPGATYTVCIVRDVELPYADKGFLAAAVPARITVVGKYALSVDRFREDAA